MVIYVFVLIDVLCDNGNSVYKERESIFKMNFGKSEYIVRKEYFNFTIFHKNVLASNNIVYETVKSSEILPKHNGYGFISESFALN